MTDRTRLTDLARAATPGPWFAWYDDYERGTWCIGPDAETIFASNLSTPEAEYVAAVSPDVILQWDRDTSALLQRVAELEALLGELADSIEDEYPGWDVLKRARAALVSDTVERP